jgi:hypothetical protein
MIQTENGPQKLTFAAFQQRKKRREVTYPLVTDDDAVKAFQLADQALNRAKLMSDKRQIAQAQKTLDEAESAVRESTLLMRLRALPRDGEHSYKVLMAEHPPTAEDNAEAAEESDDPKAKARWHAETFGPALVSACLIEPEVTVEQATEWASEWNDAEWNGLVWAAISVNQQRTDTAGLSFS